MLNRLRKLFAWFDVFGHVVDELLVGSAVVLIAVGLWDVWRPGSFIVPGLVLLWIALPARAPFITRPAQGSTPRRRAE